MPDPSTTRLALYKSKSDGSEDVSYPQDIGGNWDKVDAAVGAVACTSTTRPSTPWNGQLIRETNTGRIWVSNGSAPASGSWSEIVTPGTLQTFTTDVTINGGSALSIRTNTTDAAFRTRVTGDTQSRFQVLAGGQLLWGPGGATVGDTNLYRSAANQLATDDSLAIAGDLTIGPRAQGRGLMSEVTIPQSVLSTTTEIVLGTAPSFTWKNGRAYRVKVWGYASSTSASYLYLRLRKGATISGVTYVDQMRVPTLAGVTLNVIADVDVLLMNVSGADITTALSLTGQAASGSTPAQWSSNGTSVNSYMTVEDVGLAADWPGNAIG